MSNTVQMSPSVAPGYVDPRKLPGDDRVNDSGTGTKEDFSTRYVDNGLSFVANAAGSTTTLVGANADVTTGSNVVRLGEQFVLVDSAGDLKEATVFTVDSIASAASDTITFSPAAAVATVSGDEAHIVGISQQDSIADIDKRLLDLGFSQTEIDPMTLNDKQYQIRTIDDPDSIFVRNDNVVA